MIQLGIQLVTAFLLVSGAFFILLAALGTLRFTEFFSRMHAATKASSFGVVQMLLAAAIGVPDLWVALQSLLIIGFIFLTNPVSAHLIARACYRLDIDKREGLIVDELRDKYDLEKEDRKDERPKGTVSNQPQ